MQINILTYFGIEIQTPLYCVEILKVKFLLLYYNIVMCLYTIWRVNINLNSIALNLRPTTIADKLLKQN